MICYERVTSTEELRDHIEANHQQTYKDKSQSPLPQDTLEEEDEEEEEEEQEEKFEEKVGVEEEIVDRRGERETSEFISNMLGTKPAVIDHIISSKSTPADAAKLLGVR